tara:strand:- start:42 stop:866 length:825 start_codon:yes stop_codon:yes gene_type:complete
MDKKLQLNKKKYDAIILSSSFNEDFNELKDFIKHLCKKSIEVSSLYKILPVIVFERIEIKKAKELQEYFKNGYKEIYPLILINKKSKGFAACLNYGLLNTKSKYVFRIDTDDRFEKDRIYKQIYEMRKNDLDICSSYMIDQNNKLIKYPKNKSSLLLALALGINPIAHPTICFKKDIFLKYNEKLTKAEDLEIWLRMLLAGEFKFKCLNYPLTRYDTRRSLDKDSQNAKMQIYLRVKFILKILIIGFPIFVGILPNILRVIFGNNLFLLFRRNI